MWTDPGIWEYINLSQTHDGNWDWGRAIPRKVIHNGIFVAVQNQMDNICSPPPFLECTRNALGRWADPPPLRPAGVAPPPPPALPGREGRQTRPRPPGCTWQPPPPFHPPGGQLHLPPRRGLLHRPLFEDLLGECYIFHSEKVYSIFHYLRSCFVTATSSTQRRSTDSSTIWGSAWWLLHLPLRGGQLHLPLFEDGLGDCYIFHQYRESATSQISLS